MVKHQPNKRMQSDHPTHYASCLAADARRYVARMFIANSKNGAVYEEK